MYEIRLKQIIEHLINYNNKRRNVKKKRGKKGEKNVTYPLSIVMFTLSAVYS